MHDDILQIVKSRLGRLDDILDEYLLVRIQAACESLFASGIHLTGDVRDNVLVADVVCWEYANRDKPGGEPEWLRFAKRQRWLQDNGGG